MHASSFQTINRVSISLFSFKLSSCGEASHDDTIMRLTAIRNKSKQTISAIGVFGLLHMIFVYQM